MRRIRFAKVRVTDYRPPGAGGKRPLERQGATRGGSVAGMKMEAMHDHAVAEYAEPLAAAVHADLTRQLRRRVHAGFDLRWVQERAAALQRRLTLKPQS